MIDYYRIKFILKKTFLEGSQGCKINLLGEKKILMRIKVHRNAVCRKFLYALRRGGNRIKIWLRPHIILTPSALHFYSKRISSCSATHLAYGRCYKYLICK